ncbi:lysine--tRNA ligase [Desulfurococcaceae archaeon MEX13E-LK6-19]|nr:lysine--tRNA ligase [Desulfurococcaceae archaeon MEX13E-LK6-19]
MVDKEVGECIKRVEEYSKKVEIPYPYLESNEMKYVNLDRVADIIKENTPEIKWDREVRVAGRIMAVRIHGGLSFADLYDEGYRIQLYVAKNIVGEEKYAWFTENVRRGDILWVKGVLIKTKRGELSIKVSDYRMLVKCMVPLQHTWIGIEDPELRYRKRYLDFVLNKESYERIKARFNLIKEIRLWMYEKGFYEADTPILQPVYGGAAAKPFKTYVNALDEEWFLRIAPELYLKRLLVGGYNKVFEIAKVFRNEDIDVTHHPEFTMMEAYIAYADYNDMMELAEKLLGDLVVKMTGGYTIRYPVDIERVGTWYISQLDDDVLKEALEYTIHTYTKGKRQVTISKTALKEFKKDPVKYLVKKIGEPRLMLEINLKPPYPRYKLLDLLREHVGIDPDTISDEEIKKLLEEKKIIIKGGYNRDIALVKLFEHYVEKKLVQPTFVIDYPKGSSPLAKPHRKDPRLVERFELFIAGLEVANGYTEQNNALEQYLAFKEQELRRKLGDEEAHEPDYDFVEALCVGMPPAGGIGIGIDRLVMLFTGATSIKEVIPFPMVKKKSS